MSQVAEEITVSDSGYTFPVEDILTGRGAIFGKSGSGKSNTATVVVEELLAEGLPLLIVDQDGEYYGLSEEYDMLHVGADANCDRIIGVDDAEAVADIALEDNTPVILDVSGYMEEETAQEIVHVVLRRLFRRENDLKKPFLVLVEEIHEFVPEQGGHGELGEMLIRVAKRGRKRGLGICGISQRPASVSKNFITQCDWIVWHRLTWDNDTKVVGRILGSDYEDRITELSDGEAYVMTDWAEDLRRIKFRLKRVHGGGGTPGLENLGDAADRPGVSRESEDSEESETDSADGESDTAEEDTETDSFPGTPSETAGARGLGHASAEETPSESTASGPSPPTRVKTNEGNVVWEFSQMTHYLLALSAFKIRRGTGVLLRALRPTPRQEPADSTQIEPNDSDGDVVDDEGTASAADGSGDQHPDEDTQPAWKRSPEEEHLGQGAEDPRMVASVESSDDTEAEPAPSGEVEEGETTEAEETENGVDQEFVDRVLAKHDLGTDPNAEENDAESE
jgi:hypothetical protein